MTTGSTHPAEVAARTYALGQDGTRLRNRLGEVIVEARPIGKLFVPSGKVVACDPAFTDEAPPFVQAVTPGHYAIELSIAHLAVNQDQRIAAAILRLSSEAPVRWRLATTAGQDPRELKADEVFGYPVDSGLGSLMDAQAAQALDRHSRQDDQAFERLFTLLNATYVPTRSWLVLTLDEGSGLNCAIFSSGYGDGVYASYWGYDATGEVACLMTDFGLIAD